MLPLLALVLARSGDCHRPKNRGTSDLAYVYDQPTCFSLFPSQPVVLPLLGFEIQNALVFESADFCIRLLQRNVICTITHKI